MKMRSPATAGVDAPRPGIGYFQTTPLSADHSTGYPAPERVRSPAVLAKQASRQRDLRAKRLTTPRRQTQSLEAGREAS